VTLLVTACKGYFPKASWFICVCLPWLLGRCDKYIFCLLSCGQFCSTSRSDLSSQSVTQFVAMIVMNYVLPKYAAKLQLLFYKLPISQPWKHIKSLIMDVYGESIASRCLIYGDYCEREPSKLTRAIFLFFITG